MNKQGVFLLIWNLFWIGVLAYTAGDKWYCVAFGAFIGVYVGLGCKFMSLKKTWDRYQESAEGYIKALEVSQNLYLNTIKTLAEENERLKDGESWKDT